MTSGRTAVVGPQRLVLAGRVDVNRARELHQEVRALFDQGRDVSVDWSQVEAFDAAGLQILIALQLAMEATGQRLDVTAPPPPVARTLALAGLTHFFSGQAIEP